MFVGLCTQFVHWLLAVGDDVCWFMYSVCTLASL